MKRGTRLPTAESAGRSAARFSSIVTRGPSFTLVNCVLAALSAGQAPAIPPALTDPVPADIVAAYFVTEQREERRSGDGRSALHTMAFLVDQAQQMGLLSKVDVRCRAWIDGLLVASTILQHPHVVVLLDIGATARSDGGHELAGLRAAAIIQTRGDNVGIERRIQHLLNSYTNEDESTLTTQPRDNGTTFSLTDRRLPAWATFTWGQHGDYYIVAVGGPPVAGGEGVFDQIADTSGDHSRSLTADAWFRRAMASRAAGFSLRGSARGKTPGSLRQRSSVGSSVGESTSVAWYVRFDRLGHQLSPRPRRSHTGGTAVADKIRRTKEALGLTGAERGLWMVGHQGRAVVISSFLRRGGRDEVALLAGPELWGLHAFEGSGINSGPSPTPPRRKGAPSESTVIPASAGGYAAIGCDPGALLRGVREGYLAAKSPPSQRQSRSFWRSLEQSAGVSIERDIVAHLGGPIVIHDYPRPALPLPLACTILIPIAGDAGTLQGHLDRLLFAGNDLLDKEGILRLRRDDDGVWCLQYGLNGPGLAVTDRWVVISFSPQAVRDNVAFLSPEMPLPSREAPP